APEAVKAKAMEAFTLITECEAAIHGTTVERVHLHEVGSVDAILDIVGSIWGLERLGVTAVYCGTIPLGDGFVDTQHGRMAVPTAATLRLLEGLPVRPGPEGAGELVTPTGAALVRVLSAGAPPTGFVPVASGFGAGTKDFPDRANALRIVLADQGVDAPAHERLIMLAADIDDATGEELGALADALRDGGARDVVLLQTTGEELGALADALRDGGARDVVLLQTVMKKGRPGTRVECLVAPQDADRLEAFLLLESTTIGVRRFEVARRALPRSERVVSVLGHDLRVKVVTLPDGSTRAKPEADDVVRIARATGRSVREVREEVRKSL
nr:LarC family nickel insertion protein [Gemmatimonadota bacterium]